MISSADAVSGNWANTSRVGGAGHASVESTDWTQLEVDFHDHLAASSQDDEEEFTPSFAQDGGPLVLDAQPSTSGMSSRFPLSASMLSALRNNSSAAGQLSMPAVYRVMEPAYQSRGGAYSYS